MATTRRPRSPAFLKGLSFLIGPLHQRPPVATLTAITPATAITR
jgi:hypothetical protein